MRDAKETKRTQQSLKTRQAILTVSLELFVRKGFAGTTVRDIARAAKVSPGLMFHYFPSKDSLLQEHVDLIAKEMGGVSQALLLSKTPLDTFYTTAQKMLSGFEGSYTRNLFLLANQVLSLESIPSAARNGISRSRSIEASAVLISRGQRKGEIRKGDSRALAVAFWGAIQGIAEILVWNPGISTPTADQIIGLLKK